MSKLEQDNRLRREQDILGRIENVKRLIQMETTLLSNENNHYWSAYTLNTRDGETISNKLLNEVRDEIQMQLLSILAMCYGKNPDMGEPVPVLEWNTDADVEGHPSDVFWDTFEKVLQWNA